MVLDNARQLTHLLIRERTSPFLEKATSCGIRKIAGQLCKFWVQVVAVAALMERARRRQSKRFDVVAFGDMLTAALEAPNPPEAGLEVLATEYAAYADVRYAACRARRQYVLLLEKWLRQQCRVCAWLPCFGAFCSLHASILECLIKAQARELAMKRGGQILSWTGLFVSAQQDPCTTTHR